MTLPRDVIRYEILPYFNRRDLKKLLRVTHATQLPILRYLGLDFDIYDNYLLKWATRRGYHKIVIYLISKIKINQFDLNYIIVLASKHNRHELLKLLLPLQVNRIRGDCRPIFSACRRGHLEIVTILFHERDGLYGYNTTALKLACQFGHLPIVKFLVLNGVHINKSAIYEANSHQKCLVHLARHVRDLSYFQ
jgi:hypothetical protein